MNLSQIKRRGTAAAAVLALSASLAACGGGEETSAEGTAPETSESSSAPSQEETTSESAGESGDLASQVFGPACGQVPTDPSNPGSLQGMVQDPVATAASNNPLLTQLVTAVGAVQGLQGTLNSAESLTVFAPVNSAFQAIPKQQLNTLVQGAQQDGQNSMLATILTHHVVQGKMGPDEITSGELTTLAGDTLTVEGDPESGVTVSDGQVTANVLCGNVPTANATVYLIDKVMTGVDA